MSKPANVTVIETLCEYFRANIADLQVIDEFPDSNEEMTFPTLSIITSGNVDYTNITPYILSSIPNGANPDQLDIVYAIGQYDFRLQLDLWCEYKDKRGEYYEKIRDVLNKQFLDGIADDVPKGLSLPLIDYFGVIARYDQTGYTYLDGEMESQKSEWRVKIDLVSNFVEAKLKEAIPTIKEATIKHKIGENVTIDNSTDNLDETIIF